MKLLMIQYSWGGNCEQIAYSEEMSLFLLNMLENVNKKQAEHDSEFWIHMNKTKYWNDIDLLFHPTHTVQTSRTSTL